jgi:Uma2 family endonuclease
MTLVAEALPDTLECEEKLITGEELLAMGDIGPAQLIRGRIVKMTPAGYPHGLTEFNIGALLHNFVRSKNLGWVLGGEAGVYTRRNPDSVRGVDVAFISRERLAQAQPGGYLDVAPELIVEVVSPNDLWSEITSKLTEYFGIGVQMVWVVDPHKQQVHVYRSLTELVILSREDEITGGDVLPGFSVPVSEFFVA